MLLSHQKFEFAGKHLIEKIIVQAPFRLTVNFPDEACFIYFLEGERSGINSPYEQVLISSGESVLLKCGNYFADLMKNTTPGHYEIVVFHLYPDLLRKIYRHELPAFIKNRNEKIFIRKIAPHDVIKKFVESLMFYFENPDLVNEELLELKIKELILLLIQTGSADSIMVLFSELFTPREVSIREVVDGHLFSDLAIEDLAQLSNMSVSTFSRTFQTLFHDTPANYIKSKRLERAKELLEVSTQTISEIAYQTGFHDVAHFSRTFKKAYGYSPSGLRQSRLS